MANGKGASRAGEGTEGEKKNEPQNDAASIVDHNWWCVCVGEGEATIPLSHSSRAHQHNRAHSLKPDNLPKPIYDNPPSTPPSKLHYYYNPTIIKSSGLLFCVWLKVFTHRLRQCIVIISPLSFVIAFVSPSHFFLVWRRHDSNGWNRLQWNGNHQWEWWEFIPNTRMSRILWVGLVHVH